MYWSRPTYLRVMIGPSSRILLSAMVGTTKPTHVQRYIFMKRSRLNRVGPVTRKWIAFRKQWLKDHEEELYTCHYCPNQMSARYMELDHKITRTTDPSLRFVENNIVPSCKPCNKDKGTKNHDKYVGDDHICA
jgi:hypothetical protein